MDHPGIDTVSEILLLITIDDQEMIDDLTREIKQLESEFNVDVFADVSAALETFLDSPTQVHFDNLKEIFFEFIKTQDQKSIAVNSEDISIIEDFLAEKLVSISEFEDYLLHPNLESEEINFKVKGILHTLKGEAGFVGFYDIEKVCHHIEDLLFNTNAASIKDLLFTCHDWLKDSLAFYARKGDKPIDYEEFINGIGSSPPPSQDQILQDKKKAEVEQEIIFAEDFFKSLNVNTVVEDDESVGNPDMELEIDAELLADFVQESSEHIEMINKLVLDLENDSQDQDALDGLFRSFHTIKGVSGFLELKGIQSLTHRVESILDLCRKDELESTGTVIDAILESADIISGILGRLDHIPTYGEIGKNVLLVADLNVKLDKITNGEIHTKVNAIIKEEIAEVVSEAEDTTAANITAGLTANPDPAFTKKSLSEHEVKIKEVLKVDAERLDSLVNMIGELVIAESMVIQSEELIGVSGDLSRYLTQMDKITRELQHISTSLRMVSLKGTFQKMARVVRDVSRKTSKIVKFAMHGEETEIDKSIVDKIGDPLIHMLRNAIDHGIENPEDRLEAGKEECGTITISAFHKGSSIYIQIEDDGKGLDKEKILSKARERNLIHQDEATLTDDDIFQFILLPGFSTAAQVTDLSGRGVGMDVVKRNIESLRGTMKISSEMGKGTVFSINLPLTLAIIDGMIVQLADERYIIPTLSIVLSQQINEGDIYTSMGHNEMIKFQDQMIPLFRLSSLFNVTRPDDSEVESIAIVVEESNRRIALLVDQLYGQQQIVIKNLGHNLSSVLGVAGGAIMSNGDVGLILDIAGIIQLTKDRMGKEEDPLVLSS
ncbi:MAG: chemotaxis protein CheA [Lentisphaeria bacterium]|nr:chemotaxis protein CheA [Lentisphaeria bacterium]NQZ70640.1 chemotaxis protein CheA [Lentisphaeria bacterium]